MWEEVKLGHVYGGCTSVSKKGLPPVVGQAAALKVPE